MPSTSRRSLVLFVVLLALLGSTRPARAQCSGPTCHTVSGALSDATTGPLLSGHTYLFSGQVQVPQGTTLTIEPGAVIKTQHAFASLTVSGVLLCAGTPAQPIVFTSFKDDSVGGAQN